MEVYQKPDELHWLFSCLAVSLLYISRVYIEEPNFFISFPYNSQKYDYSCYLIIMFLFMLFPLILISRQRQTNHIILEVQLLYINPWFEFDLKHCVLTIVCIMNQVLCKHCIGTGRWKWSCWSSKNCSIF